MAKKVKKTATPRPVCFVISPIGDDDSAIRRHADMVLVSIIREALPNFDVRRADQFAAPDMITDKVIDAIFNSELAIADLTGQNPNVFYEVGLRHMAEKPVIHIANEGTKLPFDTSGVGTIFFDILNIHSHQRTRVAIADAATKVLEAGYKVSTPVTQARASTKLANSTDTTDQLVSTLVRRMSALEEQVRNQTLQVRLPHPPDPYLTRVSGFEPGSVFASANSAPRDLSNVDRILRVPQVRQTMINAAKAVRQPVARSVRLPTTPKEPRKDG